ncbi:MAG: ATP-binding protein [Prevotellaceae bacterium]|nr:ATP-binding protein [Prevotellaceae bacterium]MCD8285279.1 ATP-binding protein [Prevotellaceae bacterium]MCD8304178.1 ATP-binding protein [Prevotellaceae bacterium]
MTVSDEERAWLKRLGGSAAPLKATEKAAATIEKRKGLGFGDVAGMEELKQTVREGFINVLRNKERAAAYGIRPPSMLLWGPSGCGKTFFAEKMAEEAGVRFIRIVPDDLASTWVHGTQQRIAEVFSKAEKEAPVVLFFDEFDAMVPRRTSEESGQCLCGEVNEFLCRLQQAGERGVYVLAATNHPERIDRSVLRTGRIDELVYVDMPDLEARQRLFRLALSRLPSDGGIDYERLARLTAGYNCSDIDYIIKTASRKTFNESIAHETPELPGITQDALETAILRRSPSVLEKDLREYERVRLELSPRQAQGQRRLGFR